MADVNLHAMRLGPGKHLKGLSLFHGSIKPEEVCPHTYDQKLLLPYFTFLV